MVPTKVNKRKAVSATKTASFGSRRSRPSPRGERANSRAAALRNTLKIAVLVAVFAVGAVGVYFAISYFLTKNSPIEAESTAVELEPEPEPEPVVVLPDKIDFQPVVDGWVGGAGGNKSVLIYDLERNEVVSAYNATENYNTASLYKLFVVYEGYRRVQSGEWQASDPAGSTGYNILKCLDLAIRESYSPCAETLWAMIGRQELTTIIENDYGITNSDIESLISNPEDIMKMMKIFYEHKDVTDENLIATMKDSFLTQPPTTYNWRQGLPSGFTKANVYNKVGWDYNPDARVWNIYHDAAIVEFPDKNRHYIVVVMTNQVPYQKITALGKEIEEKFYAN